MSADEARSKSSAAPAQEKNGPRHAAPRKPLITRLHVPAGRAIALAAMPTAVLMGMGFTPTLALADDQPSNSQQADEYKDCVAALEDGASASATPSPSASASDGASDGPTATAEPTPSATSSPDTGAGTGTGTGTDSGKTSSSDSGSDDKADPTPSPSASKDTTSGSGSADTATPSPSASESGGNLLEDIGDTIGDILTGGGGSTASATPTPTASASASRTPSGQDTSSGASDASGTVKETEKVTDTVNDTVKDATATASAAAADATAAANEAAADATASPSPSASSTTDPADCPVATDEEGGVDNKIDLPDDPWYLNASSLYLKGADYQGVVKVRTSGGKIKEVLKYVISGGTEIGDLHQTVKDEKSGKTYHVQAGKGTTSTITGGDTIMYTESISGNLFGLIPITFSPENPPPLNIPLIYFTNAKVQQAGQFGGTLTVPGLHQYAD